MIRSTVLAALAAATPAIAAQPAPVSGDLAPVSGDLALVQQHLRGIETMTADFAQTDRTGRTLTGVLTIKKPGRIRFQYEKGVPILIVAEGGALNFIDYSVHQLQRWPIKNSPLSVLLDPDRDIARYARIVPALDSRTIAVEASDPKHPEYGRITLAFTRDPAGPAGLVLGGWVILDGQGNRTSVRLANQKFGVPVADNSFAWRDPRKGH